jgi:hypothetical protein
MNKKIIFNITFHWQLEQLKFHIDNLFSWSISNDSMYVVTTAHAQNLESIKSYCLHKYPEKNVQFCFIERDMGYHIGTIVNVIESIKYIDSNFNYDYLVNIEADNMFYDESKLLRILNKMSDSDKHALLIEEGYGKEPYNKLWPHLNIPKYLHTTTINVYSKHFIETFFPKEYNEELMNFGWCGNPGTPFEPYLSLSFIKKNNLYSDEVQMNFWNKYGLRLDYDRSRIVRQDLYRPDDMTPDKFMRWGIVNCPSTAGNAVGGWEIVKTFIEFHKPLMYDPEW